MSWRIVVISKRAKLDLRYDNLIVRTDEEHLDISISEISTLMLETTAVSITVALLAKLIERKVKVIVCDGNRDPIGELVPYYGRHDSSLSIRKQLEWDDEIKELIWCEIVKDKIQKQAELLKCFNKPNVEKLEQYYLEVERNDSTNREGHAAKVYFNALFGVGFSREMENPTNAALNYGYKIILSMFNRELSSLGYLTQIGIFHKNQYNPFNLSSDFMEPYRILVDELVFRENFQEFGTPQKRIVQKLNERKVMIDGKSFYLKDSITIYTRSVIKALEEKDIEYIRQYMK